MDQSVLKIVKQLEEALKDKSVHYLVVVADGLDVKYKYDSKVAAKGMVDMVAQEINEDWKESRPRNDEEGS